MDPLGKLRYDGIRQLALLDGLPERPTVGDAADALAVHGEAQALAQDDHGEALQYED